MNEIDAFAVKDKFPLFQTEDVLAGFHVESDGRVNPHEAAMALALASKQMGV